jgi:hypothetical protein
VPLLPVAAAVVLEESNPGEHLMRICHEFGVPGVVQARFCGDRDSCSSTEGACRANP